MSKPIYENISNDQVNTYLMNIVRDMTLSEYKPDYIIGIWRGGSDTAVKLSHYYGDNAKATLFTPYSSLTDLLDNIYDDWAKSDFGQGSPNILIVDEICDSGTTLHTIREEIADYIASCYTKKIKFAALLHNINNHAEVEFYGREISRAQDPDIWYVFPWENWWKNI